MTNKEREFWLDHDCYYTQEEIEYSASTEYPINPVNLIHTIEYSTYQALLEQAEKMAEALENLEGHTLAHLQFRHKDIVDLNVALSGANQILKSWKEFKK